MDEQASGIECHGGNTSSSRCDRPCSLPSTGVCRRSGSYMYLLWTRCAELRRAVSLAAKRAAGYRLYSTSTCACVCKPTVLMRLGHDGCPREACSFGSSRAASQVGSRLRTGHVPHESFKHHGSLGHWARGRAAGAGANRQATGWRADKKGPEQSPRALAAGRCAAPSPSLGLTSVPERAEQETRRAPARAVVPPTFHPSIQPPPPPPPAPSLRSTSLAHSPRPAPHTPDAPPQPFSSALCTRWICRAWT